MAATYILPLKAICNLSASVVFRFRGPLALGAILPQTRMITGFFVFFKNLPEQHRFNEKFVHDCKIAEDEEKEKPHTPFTAIDRLISIWDEISPQRQLRLLDAKFTAVLNKDGKIQEYSSNQMSDGERAVLYLAAQVLCVPENKTLIIDEPELHLHRSIMNRLWVALENHRPDCLFIYITHDTQFAAMHGHADKIWIKEF